MPGEAKKRMIRSAAALFRQHGYSGTGFRDVIAHSRAPRGSIYHHFPGGKAQLGAETVRSVGEWVGAGLDELADRGDPITMVKALVASWRHTLVESEFRAGCPIVAVAAEHHPESPELADAAAAAFARWQKPLTASLRNAGVRPTKARRLAALITASVEGAIILGRATRSTEPLDNVGKELEQTVRDALPAK
jgi:AcrR family transcriptional regulator